MRYLVVVHYKTGEEEWCPEKRFDFDKGIDENTLDAIEEYLDDVEREYNEYNGICVEDLLEILEKHAVNFGFDFYDVDFRVEYKFEF